uniref:Carbonic anhydrase n=1 Tax=Archaeoglobus fulgidus TaxID=2234 RepID=A0A7C2NDR3_ARCFL
MVLEGSKGKGNEFSGNLAIFCSDERFAFATIDFIKQVLKMDNFDLIVVPGGPAFIAQSEVSLIDRLELLLRAHKIKKIALVAHEDCGYYRSQNPELSPENIHQKQLDDISKAVKDLNRRGIEVFAFFAFVEGNEVVFKELSSSP